MHDHDVVIVGGGPAGLTAASWVGRFRRKALVVDSCEYRNRWVDELHGFHGMDPAAPDDLRATAHRDLERYPHVRILTGQVSSARRLADGGFELVVNGSSVRTRRVILATGVRDVFPHIERFLEFYGSDVFHCPTCDGFEAQGRSVAVFGWGPHVAGFALELLDWAERVRIVTNGGPLHVGDGQRRVLAEHGVEVVEDEAVELLGERGDLRGVRLAGGGTIDCSMAFFSIEHRPVTDLAEQLGCSLDDQGYVRVDEAATTSVPGVYAAGDVTGGIQLVGVAVGQGTAAGVACAQSLRGERAVPGAPTPAPRPERAMPHDAA